MWVEDGYYQGSKCTESDKRSDGQNLDDMATEVQQVRSGQLEAARRWEKSIT